MLLILTKSNDLSSHKVIRYLHKSIDFIRINDDQHIDVWLNGLSDLRIRIDGISLIKGENISKIWYRTGKIFTGGVHSNPIVDNINKREEYFFKEYLIFLLENRFDILGSISQEFNLNKLNVLSMAHSNGLRIPFSVVTNHKNISIEKDRFFVKTVSNIPPFTYKGFRYAPIYELLTASDYSDNSVSFFQEYVNKKFEIRSFFLYGEIYSMAIFSQNDPDTRYDFRNYNLTRPNRNVPFKLPIGITRKISALMRQLKLNTGSIDFIYSDTNQFVFLEINPSGQFDWLSVNCNDFEGLGKSRLQTA